ncbi:selection and upkeep of intraepithelial T-cells protein 1-like [Archocentrus centrarchus]|uniref:selection and upkeep of intraepithelial T-cells protein 1-like n=1 Tax=Archocentrus centrarchus TaxID=63155 RepID=UPI0011EA03DE|nr:selection and upkeep of intraepithelial T-cells protein 1-like [Archocentrus centrarchus]
MSARTAVLCLVLLFLSILKFVSAEQEIITAVCGQNISLARRAPNTNIVVVEWSRADLGTEYVLLYRDGKSLLDNQHESFKNRVDLQDRKMKDGDASLVLKNVTTDDTGTYECRVKTRTNRRKRANLTNHPITTINLSVAPPGQPGGTTEDGGSVGLIVGLSVAAVLLVAAVGGFLIDRKHKQKQDPCQPPAEQQPV